MQAPLIGITPLWDEDKDSLWIQHRAVCHGTNIAVLCNVCRIEYDQYEEKITYPNFGGSRFFHCFHVSSYIAKQVIMPFSISSANSRLLI